MSRTVSRFLLDGYRSGECLLVAATAAHWALIAESLEKQGCPVGDAVKDGQLTVQDANDTLQAFMRGGVPDPIRFFEAVGSVVRRLGAQDRGLRVYGEMVNILAESGDYDAAYRLEEIWNDLAAHQSLSLFCGYLSAHFSDARTATALGRICRAHTHVQTSPADELAGFLLAQPDSAHGTPASRSASRRH